ncbi:MAG: N-acetylmuramic acid 6-phosphate etherase, partial [Phycisphaerae bacterium]|nr:N-acetylmuramic acid 6-phosphate etherase [Phycisphaerae bacterium]
MSLPPDRSHIATEQINELTVALDTLTTKECVALLAKDQEIAIKAVQLAHKSLSDFIDALIPKVQSGGRLVYIGCGTSGRLGVLDASECPPTFQSAPDMIIGLIAGGDSALRTSSEKKEDKPDGVAPEFARITLTSKDTVLGIAAGGTTPWVVGGLALAKKYGALTGFLTCSHVPTCADHMLVLETGPEAVTGSTRLKAGTATKIALNIITTTLFTQLGKVYGNMMVDVKATNDKLLDRAIRIVSSTCSLDRAASAALLTSSNGSAKVAIVMHKYGIEA